MSLSWRRNPKWEIWWHFAYSKSKVTLRCLNIIYFCRRKETVFIYWCLDYLDMPIFLIFKIHINFRYYQWDRFHPYNKRNFFVQNLIFMCEFQKLAQNQAEVIEYITSVVSVRKIGLHFLGEIQQIFLDGTLILELKDFFRWSLC